ncbi:MAG: dipeptidase [Devosia sp.]|uniref:dipeptidase n=1 Tax=Devosia sp. TaxID=1871048 RepID=UPI001AC78549|nr:dipeptidase [Devosia sp.]MBN9316031.1 dipeptidase [Devosia sp.]
MPTPPIFDGHNDVLLRLMKDTSPDPVARFLEGGGPGHIDLPKARAGNLAGGMFAVFCPSPDERADFTTARDMSNTPLPPELPMDLARRMTTHQVALLLRLEAASNGAVTVCRSAADIRAAMARGSLAAVLHIEGAEAIDADLHFLDVLYAAGLRSIGPVWSRTNVFGYGVPFRFPHSPDLGPGLTDAGKRLVRACNEKRILVDLSHITEKGFWDVAALSTAPLVATHSNVHALTQAPRNLTADQLRAIRDSDGMVGLNFATGFLRADGQMRADTPIDDMVRHLDGLIEALGETRVGMGSDFDGALVPADIGDASGLPRLFEALERHGYDAPLLEKLAHGNWLSLLERTIG